MTKTFWFFRCCLAQPTLQTPPCTSVPLIRGGSSHSNYQGTGVQGYRGVYKVVWAKPQLGYCISIQTSSFSYVIHNMS